VISSLVPLSLAPFPSLSPSVAPSLVLCSSLSRVLLEPYLLPGYVVAIEEVFSLHSFCLDTEFQSREFPAFELSFAVLGHRTIAKRRRKAVAPEYPPERCIQ